MKEATGTFKKRQVTNILDTSEQIIKDKHDLKNCWKTSLKKKAFPRSKT